MEKKMFALSVILLALYNKEDMKSWTKHTKSLDISDLVCAGLKQALHSLILVDLATLREGVSPSVGTL